MAPKKTEWMSSAEAADYLGVVLRTLVRFIGEDGLPAHKDGRVLKLRREDIDDWVEAHRVKPGELSHLYPAGVEEERAQRRVRGRVVD